MVRFNFEDLEVWQVIRFNLFNKKFYKLIL